MRNKKKNAISTKTKVIVGITSFIIGMLLITSLIFIFENKDKINKLQKAEKPYIEIIEKR